MSDSRLFTSSLTRRQLARRRPLRPAWRQLSFALLVVAVCLAAFAAGHHGL